MKLFHVTYDYASAGIEDLVVVVVVICVAAGGGDGIIVVVKAVDVDFLHLLHHSFLVRWSQTF